jgi:hypothetical protein
MKRTISADRNPADAAVAPVVASELRPDCAAFPLRGRVRYAPVGLGPGADTYWP